MADIERVKAFIQSSFSQIKSIKDIARAFNLSQETLRKDFVRREKTTLSQFISGARVAEMKSLLVNSAQPCNEICLAVGFSREEVGERVFKRKVGMTMKEFRKITTSQHEVDTTKECYE